MVQRIARAKPLGRRRARLLIVDDDREILRVLQRILANHEVTVAASAKDALQRLMAGSTFDLILCDLMMPEMTGIELHSALCERIPDQAERMVFLTGGSFDSEADVFVHSSGQRFMAKPFEIGELHALVMECIDQTEPP